MQPMLLGVRVGGSKNMAEGNKEPRENRIDKQSGQKGNDGPRLSSVATAIRLLKEFSEEDAELGISALARRLGVAKSTAHRLAATLLSEGLLEQDPLSERYRLGLGLFQLGALVRKRLSVSAEAKTILTELRLELRENVALAVPKGPGITFLYDFESPQSVRVRSRLGISKTFIECAEGIAILSFQATHQQNKLINEAVEDSAKNAILQLKKRIEDTRNNGYSIDCDELQPGLSTIAAPVCDSAGDVIAAVGMTGPSQRLDQGKLESLAERVIASADNISRKLGAHVVKDVVEIA
jgi:DNA-binding IclR family transcriptional regulator